MNLTKLDKLKLEKYGISEENLKAQIRNFEQGFSPAKIVKPALVDEGIICLSSDLLDEYSKLWEKESKKYKTVKFVPASGAATRMFKDLYDFKESYNRLDYPKFVENKAFGSMYYFFKHLDEFAFWDDLKSKYKESGDCIEEDMLKKNFLKILDYILEEKGLNYGSLPKALIHFHKYEDEIRKAIDEHLVEAASYASSNDNAHIHFTVSKEHQNLFQNRVNEILPLYERKFGLNYEISFSNQQHSSDTVAVTLNNEIYRDKSKSMVLRPGGHGALIQNLNAISSDIIFIKNIDNVALDSYKESTKKYRLALAGLLLFFKEKIHGYINDLEMMETLDDAKMDEIGSFLEKNLCILPSVDFKPKNRLARIKYLYQKLNRPIRVCGMVKNEGEPGGGPFWAENADGTVSLQIVESAQMDLNDENVKDIVSLSTHFNPVDIVCYVKDFEGNKFDLTKYIDHKSGFIANKSIGSDQIKAMELPGLWNGAMADWITIFMEIPIDSFSPVKKIQDLLKPKHKA